MFVREALEHGLRFSWTGQAPSIVVTDLQDREVTSINVWNPPLGKPAIEGSDQFGAMCNAWLQRQGLHGATSVPSGPSSASGRQSGGLSSGGSVTTTVSWDQFISSVASAYPTQEEDYYTAIYTGQGQRRMHVSHVTMGGLDCVEFLGPLGPVSSFDLGRALPQCQPEALRADGPQRLVDRETRRALADSTSRTGTGRSN